jgi:heat shock protein HslJ
MKIYQVKSKMGKNRVLVILLIIGIFVAACADQNSTDTDATDLPPEPGSGTGDQPVEVATVTESPDSPVPAEAGPPLTADQIQGVLWQWRDLVELDSGGETVVPDPKDYSVVFQDEGLMTIQADCNTVSASYLIDSGQLRIILGPSTMAFCGEESLDVTFLNHLSKATSGTVDENGRMKLFTSEGVTLNFDNAGAPTFPVSDTELNAIANIIWQWRDLVETQPTGQSNLPNPEDYMIGFRYDGSVTVQADCNNLLGSYELQGGKITITLGPTTMVDCGEESLDQQFLTFLEAVDSYRLEGSRLELYSKNGAALGFVNGGKLPGTAGISPGDISLDTTGVAESWQAFVVQKQPYDTMPSGAVGLPEHIAITFNGQNFEQIESSDPMMVIIPVVTYELMFDLNNDEAVTRIMNQIAAMTYDIPQPPPASGIPALPPGQMGTGFNDLAVNVGRVGADSESASKNGYRFVGRWNQDPNPVTNQGMRYVYQGFTNDGAFLVSYWNPVRTAALPDGVADLSREVMEAFNNDPVGNINIQAANLNHLDSTDWQPDLNDLDALVASLKIEGMISSGLQGKTWAWTGRGRVDNESLPVENPAQYTITYNLDGTFSFEADCNAGGGGYSVIGGFNGRLHHTLGPSTLAACPPDSRADEFIGALAAVESFRLLPGGQEMQLLLPTGDLLGFVEEQILEIDIPEPLQDMLPTGMVKVAEGVFVRTGPGNHYPSLGVAPLGESGTIIGVSEDGQWWVIEAPAVQSGQVWVPADFVEALNAENVPVVPAPVLPTPIPTPSPAPPPSPSISFTTDSKSLNMGDCTNLHWDVENIQAVWVYPAGSNYKDFPQTGLGSQQVCPEQTMTYEMRVLHVDGSTEIRSITIKVDEPDPLANNSWQVTSLYTS